MTITELNFLKREIKKKILDYENYFFKEFHRLVTILGLIQPLKDDKVSMRKEYQFYNEIKLVLEYKNIE